MRAALIQLNSSDDPVANVAATVEFVAEAASHGAKLILTPEVTNCVSLDRRHQSDVLHSESADKTLARLRETARSHGIWLLIGSLALKTDDRDGRSANRSFLVEPTGRIAARYDKIHMFDVDISATEKFRESAAYRPGDAAVLAQMSGARIGLSICYDLRFAALYRILAQAGAEIITVPSAFAVETGRAHWRALLRARAIETGAFILAPAQTGVHGASVGKARETYGHSLAVSPWGEVLADGGTEPGVTLVDLDLREVEDARRRIPSLQHDRRYTGP